MITSFEVGAVFRIVNDASPQLRILIEQVAKLDTLTKSVTDNFAKLGAAFAPLGLEAGRATEKMLAGLRDFDLGIDRSIGKVAELREAMKALGSGRVGSGRLALAGGPGGGGSGGPHFGSVGVPLPGGAHMRFGGNAALAGLGMLGYGVLEEAEIEDIAARAMLTGQIKTDAGMTQTDAFKQIRDVIQRVAAQTGFGPKQVGEAILTTERQFGGLSFKDRLGLEETLIPFAASEARMKETSLSEAFEAMVGLSHMTGTYDPKQLPELMRQFQYASMITPVGINQFRGALSYSLPMLHAGLDMDPSSIMFLTAMTQTAGITNTKSGTWLRSFFENAEPHLGGTKGDDAKNDALRSMGLLNADLGVTWQVKGSDGKIDWNQSIVKMSELINNFTQHSDPATRLSTIRRAFGERGGGEASLMNLTQFIEQFPLLQAKMKAFQGGNDVLGALGDASTVQQARIAWAETQNILMDIGKNVLPIVNAGLKGLNAALAILGGNWIDKLAAKDVLGVGGWVTRKSTRGGTVPILGGVIPPPHDFTDPDAPAPGATEKSGGVPGGSGFYVPGVGWTDASGKPVDAIHAGVLAALQDWSGVGLGGDSGGGFGGRYGHGAGGRFGHNATGEHAIFSDWSKAGASPSEREAFIRKTAAALGIDPGIAMRVARSEGFHVFTGDNGHSHGDFQLYDRGEGALFHAATGLDPANPANWMAADKWALTRASKNGWGAWHGARNTGIGDHQGIGHAPVQVHSEIHIDGQKVAKVVTHHQTKSAMFPRSAPFHSSYGYATSPDVGFETG